MGRTMQSLSLRGLGSPSFITRAARPCSLYNSRSLPLKKQITSPLATTPAHTQLPSDGQPGEVVALPAPQVSVSTVAEPAHAPLPSPVKSSSCRRRSLKYR
ncbi:MAG: hypothetical protein C0184_01660 [Chloroflexus aggregans]|uniref:Uncharacterized protein n=1 Tax=Chloroflexus aggregans TaxID=152260 RepID=A0A2J6XDV0_9CHLR|nr:MAG: hypothetical protein C0184_01660 [Chloroflexus aggregans]